MSEQDPGSRALQGLSREQAAARLAAEGPNEIASDRPRSLLRIAWEVVREPMLLLLVAAGVLNLVISALHPSESRIGDAVLLFAFVIVVISITFFQERKTERALEALRDLSSPRALVVRAGEQVRIAGREVVRGDVVLLAEGDRVPADAVLASGTSLNIDESLLTGESVPVRKAARSDGEATMGRPGGDGTPWVFSGTLVVRGQGIAEVVRTGASTELGRIGAALKAVESQRTPLQADVERLVRALAILGLGLAALVVVVFALTRGDWLEGSLAGITLAMAMLPEEFPVVLTVFLALGAWRISKQGVLTRRTPAIELLGAATVLCTDKTGTVTANRMTVRELWTIGGARQRIDGGSLPEPFHRLVEFAVLASPIDPFDPMDAAFKQLGDRYLAQTEHLHADWRLVREYPLSEHLLALSHVWRSPGGGDYVIAAKGAPEAIADLCHLGEVATSSVAAEVTRMGDEGLRVLGVAHAAFTAAGGLPEAQHDFAFEFVGLLGLEDPVREEVPAAVAQASSAGMRVVMITGDYPATAMAVARKAGIRGGGTLTGPELEQLDEDQLADRAGEISVFARVVPEQKLRIVRALQRRGEVVAMTGDGVNDAPALKAADIGVAMGERGTDVAREAADLVLTDDAFSSIVGAVRGGRRIYDNLKKAMAYILAVHVPIAGISLLPVLIPSVGGHTMPLVLMPVHIAFLELIIDPACSIVFEAEPEETDVMDRPPRSITEPMFGRRLLALSVAQGLVVLVVALVVYGIAVLTGASDTIVRALTFTTLVTANLGLIFVNRSWTKTVIAGLGARNRALWWVTLGTAGCLALLLLAGPARDLFGFGVLPAGLIGVAVVAGAASVAWFDAYKVLHGRRSVPVPPTV